MKEDRVNGWGARIERGVVKAANADALGVMRYTIESYDRPGLTATQITNATNLLPQAGMKVCFFMFDDGMGCIVGALK